MQRDSVGSGATTLGQLVNLDAIESRRGSTTLGQLINLNSVNVKRGSTTLGQLINLNPVIMRGSTTLGQLINLDGEYQNLEAKIGTGFDPSAFVHGLDIPLQNLRGSTNIAHGEKYDDGSLIALLI